MRIIFISPNRLLHEQWSKAFSSKEEIINIYNEYSISEFEFKSSDICLLDFDNNEEYLNLLLKTKVFCLSSKLDEKKGFILLKKGVKAYGNTYMTPLNLSDAIKLIKSGKVWVYPELMNFILENTTLKQKESNLDIESLSSRENQVGRLVAKGLNNIEISKNLDISERTVKAHIASCFKKLDVKDRVQLGLRLKDYYNL